LLYMALSSHHFTREGTPVARTGETRPATRRRRGDRQARPSGLHSVAPGCCGLRSRTRESRFVRIAEAPTRRGIVEAGGIFDAGCSVRIFFTGKKSIFSPSTLTKVHFSSLNFKTGQITSLNFSNRAFYLPRTVLKAVLLQ
jgi:hypothetical protein